MTTHHRASTALKQQNKPFKGASKNRNARVHGKMEKSGASASAASLSGAAKVDRRNRAKMIQKAKRDALLAEKRLFQGPSGVPKNIIIVPLCPDVQAEKVISSWVQENGLKQSEINGSYFACDRFKSKFRFTVVNYEESAISMIQMVQAADFVVYLLSAETEVDEKGENILRCIKASAALSHISLIQSGSSASLGMDLEESSEMMVDMESKAKNRESFKEKKQMHNIVKSVSAYMEDHFPESNSVCGFISNPSDMWNSLRFLSEQRPKPIQWRDKTPYLCADSFEVDGANGILKVTGYARGTTNFSANRIVHIPRVGDFQLSAITSAMDPLRGAHKVSSAAMSCEGSVARNDDGTEKLIPKAVESVEPGSILQLCDPVLREDLLLKENIPDTFASEQTFPTDEELAAGDKRIDMILEEAENTLSFGQSEAKKTVMAPKGTSAYQAAWLMDDDVENLQGGEEEIMKDYISDNDELEEITLDGDADKHEAENRLTEEEERIAFEKYQKQRKRELDDAINFPDEVDTPLSELARVRFARYRALESLRTSQWDPYESLPSEYARLYQFHNVKVSAARSLEHGQNSGVESNQRITLHISVCKDAWSGVLESIQSLMNIDRFIVYGLQRHEHKMSVMHFRTTLINGAVSEDNDEAATYKSKDEFVLWSGTRLQRIRPIFSQYSRGPLHKMLRYVRTGETFVGSYYGPVQFEPFPALLFKQDGESGELKLIGTGNMMNPNPQRMIIKRTVLSGHPFKVHRKSAVVRYMFFKPEDISWFKPVPLYTKIGRRRGHIKESVGTHGYMKCIFDKPIQQQDTVCMALYKRVFPKWSCTSNF